MTQSNQREVLWKVFETITDPKLPYLQMLIDDSNVSGLDVGFKVYERFNDDTQPAARDVNQLAIRLHVRQKSMVKIILPETQAELEADPRRMFRQVLPHDAQRNYYREFVAHVLKRLKADGKVEGSVDLVLSRETDIIQMRPRNRSCAAAAAPAHHSTGMVQPGISIGHKNRRAGTLGAIVYQPGNPNPLLLSCWHVLSMPHAMPESRILQPGPSDGGEPESDWIAMLEPQTAFPSTAGDAALARILAPDIMQRQVVRGQFGTDDGTGHPIVVEKTQRISVDDLGEVLEKSGKTTGVTRGRIDGVGVYFLDYGMRERIPVHGFKIVPLQGETREISGPGDSGALWYRVKDHAGVGLHFEGEKNQAFDAEEALACHLEPILDALRVSLIPPT